VFLWNKEVCLGYCIMFCCMILKAVIQLLYIFEIDSKFHKNRNNIACAVITSLSGRDLLWVAEMRYLGVYFMQSCSFKCSLDHAKRSFYRAANSIFGKIGRIAPEEVILQLVKSKCVPVLLYGLEACALNKSQIGSLDFVINRFFMKLFKTNNIEIVNACREQFSFQLPSVVLLRRKEKLESNVLTVFPCGIF